MCGQGGIGDGRRVMVLVRGSAGGDGRIRWGSLRGRSRLTGVRGAVARSVLPPVGGVALNLVECLFPFFRGGGEVGAGDGLHLPVDVDGVAAVQLYDAGVVE